MFNTHEDDSFTLIIRESKILTLRVQENFLAEIKLTENCMQIVLIK